MTNGEPSIHKFEATKESALSGETCVKFDFGGFALLATRAGIQFCGHSPIIGDMEDLQALAKTIDKIWREHKKLIPKIDIAQSIPN